MSSTRFWLLTAALLVVTRDVSLLAHEWAHATVAWTFGLVSSPFDVTYGDWFLFRVTDKGALIYPGLFRTGQGHRAGFIAIAGPATNAVLAVLGLGVSRSRRVGRRPLLYFAIFWLTLNNLGQVFSYLPVRGFSSNGDIAIFDRAFGFPHIVLFIVVSVGVFGALAVLLLRDLPHCIATLHLARADSRWLLRLAAGQVFFWYGAAAADDYGPSDIRSISFPLSVSAGMAFIRWRVGAFRES